MDKIKILEKRKLKALGFLIILFGVSTFFLNYGFSQNNLKLVDKSNSFKEDFTELKISTVVSPIYIDDTVSGSDWAWAVTQSWCTGSGTSADPYVLESLEIDGLGGECISIQNSNAYFIIRTCTLYNGYRAVYLYNVANGKVTQNSLSDNSFGIYIYGSTYNEIVENDLYGDSGATGISLYYSNNNTIDGNDIENHYQGVRLESCSDNTVVGNINFNNTNNGIVLTAYSNFNTISENIANNNRNYRGILVDTSYANNFTGNIVQYNALDGILIFESVNNIILENIISDNSENGLVLDGSMQNHMSGNSIFNNGLNGISLRSYFSSEYSDVNNITMNAIYRNTLDGINLNDWCWNIDIWDNDIYENGMNGINLVYTDYDTIYGNVIHDNNGTGIEVSSSSGDNLFYKNFFHRNAIHAVDDGSNNYWDNTEIGNYWDNYTGTDTSPKDGIGDVPHDFGTGIDYFPIVDDANPVITINSPNKGDAFDDAASFDITIDEDYIFYMWYTLDGGVNYYFTEFTGTIDQAAWDALSDGNITLTFYANDKAENSAVPVEVVISKDTQAPIITITKPTPDKKISSNFGFELDIIEPHLDTIWYSLDGGVTNFTADTPTEKITKAAWATVTKGEVNVTFYANDTLGHIGSESVTIRKVSPTIGLDYVTTSILILAISGIAIIAIISKIHSKKRIISY